MAIYVNDEFQDEISENEEAERKLWKEPSKEELLKCVKNKPEVYKTGKTCLYIINIIMFVSYRKT